MVRHPLFLASRPGPTPGRPPERRPFRRTGVFRLHPPPRLSAAASPLADRIRALAEEAVADTDLFVVGVEVRGFEGSRVVEVLVDSPGVADAKALTTVSRSLGFVLETEDVVKGRYRLDVSTPGADQPLVDVRQYAKHVGRPLAVTFERAQDEVVTVQGELVAADGETLTLDGETAPIPLDAVRDARVVLPW